MKISFYIAPILLLCFLIKGMDSFEFADFKEGMSKGMSKIKEWGKRGVEASAKGAHKVMEKFRNSKLYRLMKDGSTSRKKREGWLKSILGESEDFGVKNWREKRNPNAEALHQDPPKFREEKLLFRAKRI